MNKIHPIIAVLFAPVLLVIAFINLILPHQDHNDSDSTPAVQDECSTPWLVSESLYSAESKSSEGNYADAIPFYHQVLICQPGNQQARAGLKKAENAAGLTPWSNEPSSPVVPEPSRDSSTEEDEQLAVSLKMLKQGSVAFSTPTKMKTTDTAKVVARIGSDEVPKPSMTEGFPTEHGAHTETAVTPISIKMRMTLASADFTVTKLSSEEQIVAGAQPTTWAWQISPKHSGKKLNLHLAAIVELHDVKRDYASVDRDISVEVDPLDATEKFVEKNAVWVFGTLGTCIAAGWARCQKRKKPKTPNWQTPL